MALPITAENRVLQMVRQLWVLPVDIRLSAHTNKLRFRPRTYSFVGKVPFLDVFDKPIAGWDVVSKWMVDHIVGALILARRGPGDGARRRSPSSSTARGRCSSSRSATASTTS